MNREAARGDMASKLLKALHEAQGADGGFGYLAGQPSATEPTALASMALGCLNAGGEAEALSRTRRWLLAQQLPQGGWPARESDPDESWPGSLALLALASDDAASDARQRGLRRLTGLAGQQVKIDPAIFAIDGSLKGWPWATGNFSWVEPTAYALIALKRLGGEAGEEAPARVSEGEALLFNRIVEVGGWNYGNRRVYGQPFEPYAETTAVALLALQDHPSRTDIQLSLGTLREALSSEPVSGLQAAWGMLCLRAFGLPEDGLSEKLHGAFARSGFLGRIPTLAVALLALSGPRGLEPFSLGGAS